MITLQKNGVTKKVAIGYSWKSLLFGVFYPAYRGDLHGLLIQFLLAFITGGLSWLIVPFTYNKRYLNRLLADGWELYEYKGTRYNLKENETLTSEELKKLPKGFNKINSVKMVNKKTKEEKTFSVNRSDKRRRKENPNREKKAIHTKNGWKII